MLTLLIIFAVIISPPTNIQGWLLVVVSEFYQAVALPGLGAVQKAEGAETRKLLQETHDAVLEELSLLKQEHIELQVLVKEFHAKIQ